jgi:hypothetical protein
MTAQPASLRLRQISWYRLSHWERLIRPIDDQETWNSPKGSFAAVQRSSFVRWLRARLRRSPGSQTG